MGIITVSLISGIAWYVLLHYGRSTQLQAIPVRRRIRR